MNPPYAMRPIDRFTAGFEPIGDPYWNPSMGFPKSKGFGMVLGIVASVVTMGAAAPMLMAATTLAQGLSAGVMLAGGVLSGVGAVTGNAKLAKIGGIMSLAGGIGAWASGASANVGSAAAGEGGAGAKTATDAIDTFTGNTSSLLGEGAGAVGDTAGVATSAVQMPDVATLSLDNVTQGAQSSLAGGAAEAGSTIPGVDAAATGGMSQAPMAQAGKINLSSMSPQMSPDLGAVTGRTTPFGNLAQQSTAMSPNIAPTAESSLWDTTKGILGKAVDFTKENPELTKIGGSLLKSGLEAGFAPNQQGLIDAQTGLYTAQSELTGAKTQSELLAQEQSKQRMQNMQAQAGGAPLEVVNVTTPAGQARAAQLKAQGIPFAPVGTTIQNQGLYSANTGSTVPANQQRFFPQGQGA